MEINAQDVAPRSKRFWAYAIDQTILSLIGIVIFMAVFSTQAVQISNAVNAFFSDPLWAQAEQLSSDELNRRTEALMSSEKVVDSVKALAHPFALATALSLLISALYYIIPTSKWGATPGKRLVHIVVRNLDGELPDPWQSSVRYFAFIGLGVFGATVTVLDLIVNKSFLPSNTAVDALSMILSQLTWILTLVSIVFIIARPDRRGLHDLIAHTVVRRDEQKAPKTP